MKRVDVTDEWLYKYMPVVDEAIIKELEDDTDYEYQFTDKFERRMKKLIRREARPWTGIFYRLSKKAAVLIICLVSALLVISMSVQAYRVRFFESVKTVLDDHMTISYYTDQDPETMQYVEPGYIPEGYQETDRITAVGWFCVIYANADGKAFAWDQILISDGDKISFDTEYDQQITKEVNGKNVVMSLYSGKVGSAYCEYGRYVYMLTTEDLSVDEVCLMFENIAE